MTYTRYQLCVVAHDVGDLVASAGGWMCDRIHAGWDVSVAVAQPRDLRPLQILGVNPLVADQGFESISQGVGTAAIAIAPEIFENNEHIRAEVLETLDHGGTEVTLWGTAIPGELHGRVDRRQHRLSGAAQAFKAHALAAAAIPPGTVGATEDLYSAGPWFDASGYDRNTHYRAAGQREDRGVSAFITER
jgi:hypothetical protein